MTLPNCPVCGGEMCQTPYDHTLYACLNCPLDGAYHPYGIDMMAALIEKRIKEEGK